MAKLSLTLFVNDTWLGGEIDMPTSIEDLLASVCLLFVDRVGEIVGEDLSVQIDETFVRLRADNWKRAIKTDGVGRQSLTLKVKAVDYISHVPPAPKAPTRSPVELDKPVVDLTSSYDALKTSPSLVGPNNNENSPTPPTATVVNTVKTAPASISTDTNQKLTNLFKYILTWSALYLVLLYIWPSRTDWWFYAFISTVTSEVWLRIWRLQQSHSTYFLAEFGSDREFIIPDTDEQGKFHMVPGLQYNLTLTAPSTLVRIEYSVGFYGWTDLNARIFVNKRGLLGSQSFVVNANRYDIAAKSYTAVLGPGNHTIDIGVSGGANAPAIQYKPGGWWQTHRRLYISYYLD